jgi:hypothetical protein
VVLMETGARPDSNSLNPDINDVDVDGVVRV